MMIRLNELMELICDDERIIITDYEHPEQTYNWYNYDCPAPYGVKHQDVWDKLMNSYVYDVAGGPDPDNPEGHAIYVAVGSYERVLGHRWSTFQSCQGCEHLKHEEGHHYYCDIDGKLK